MSFNTFLLFRFTFFCYTRIDIEIDFNFKIYSLYQEKRCCHILMGASDDLCRYLVAIEGVLKIFLKVADLLEIFSAFVSIQNQFCTIRKIHWNYKTRPGKVTLVIKEFAENWFEGKNNSERKKCPMFSEFSQAFQSFLFSYFSHS